MDGVLPAIVAKLLQLHPVGIVPAVLLRGVVPVLALGTGQRDDRPDVFRFRHVGYSTSWSTPGSDGGQSITLVMTPAPTVRPPSRMAKWPPASSATGVISSTAMLTLSPGMTISTPAGRLIAPVTSIVRMKNCGR